MEAVDYVKMMEEGLYHHYMMVGLHENDLLKRGKAEGAHDKAIETARALLTLGVNTLEQIVQATGLPLAEIEQLTNTGTDQ